MPGLRASTGHSLYASCVERGVGGSAGVGSACELSAPADDCFGRCQFELALYAFGGRRGRRGIHAPAVLLEGYVRTHEPLVLARGHVFVPAKLILAAQAKGELAG